LAAGSTLAVLTGVHVIQVIFRKRCMEYPINYCASREEWEVPALAAARRKLWEQNAPDRKEKKVQIVPICKSAERTSLRPLHFAAGL